MVSLESLGVRVALSVDPGELERLSGGEGERVRFKVRVNGKVYLVYGYIDKSRDYVAVEVEYLEPDGGG